MPTLSEFRDYQAAKGQAPERRAALQSERRAQAFVALRMEDLQSDDGWTVYRKHLTVIREAYTASMTAAETRILGDALGEELLKLKLERTKWAGVVEGINLALLLPEQLQQQAAVIEARLAGQLDSAAVS